MIKWENTPDTPTFIPFTFDFAEVDKIIYYCGESAPDSNTINKPVKILSVTDSAIQIMYGWSGYTGQIDTITPNQCNLFCVCL